ncbi:carboxymuconolactone decarboxylase family protein [Mucilaginibacter sp. CSA2-8R]|uniref:carboxymuconolactone decarboxylase family protein n=1 Tax=Mucilaginibacter sp. CSA2-8R TaxID=3141542 RepID=UPI00315D8B26
METRIKIQNVEPDAFKALYTLENYVRNSGLDKSLYELIKIRASQINGCAFCLNMHTKDARKFGETEQRIYLLNAWQETNSFTKQERAALKLTEEVTDIRGRVSDQTYNEAVIILGEKTTAKVVMAAIAINAWNRLAITTIMLPEE